MRIQCENLKDALKKIYDIYGEDEDIRIIGEDIRRRGYLGPHELFYIVAWKLPRSARGNMGSKWGKIGRIEIEDLKKITSEAFKLADQDRIEEAVEKLRKLPEVGVAVASAILTFYNPNKYGVIDIYAWKALYNEQRKSGDFKPEEYVRYLKDIREIAAKCNMTPRQVDLALWYLGMSCK
jgi:hypothetical protein